MAERPASDAATAALVELYRDARRRLEELVRAALERGAAGTAGFYQEQLDHLLRELSRLQDLAVPHAARTVEAAYSIGASAADQAIGRPAIGFSGIHRDALSVLADNLTGRLNAAAVTVGRRTNDVFRRAGLQEVAAGVATGQPRREVSAALERRLIDQGATDAVTGFVDARGRRWPLDVYAEMVARTTTREAVTTGTRNRLLETGRGLVTISQHSGACRICLPFEAKTYALTPEWAERTGYPMLETQPPFHPNCRHVMAPASANFDRFLEDLASDRITVPTLGSPTAATVAPPPAMRPVHGFAPKPFSELALAQADESTVRRRLTQKEILERDPGPEPGARSAFMEQIEREERAAARAAGRRHRDELQELEDALGPDLVEALDDLAAAGVKWAKDPDLKRALVNGDADPDFVLEQAAKELSKLEGRRAVRLEREERKGLERGAFPCFSCGHFKSRPSAVCGYCGDDPVTWGGSAADFDRAYGYDGLDSSDLGGSLGVRGRGILDQ